ncbi:MAG: protein kinase [Thermoleophilia bacterium]|nr:protein kinase [Thermoleophilia bacterium]
MTAEGLWGRLEQGFGLVSLRPRLGDDVRIRHIGEEFELVQLATRRVVPIDADEVALVRRFDGQVSVAELIVASMGEGRLEIAPVLGLIDRLVRAEMLAEYPPDLYRQVVNHLARLAGTTPEEFLALHATGADAAAAPADDDAPATGDDRPEPRPSKPEPQGPWRARSPQIAERARFLRGVALFASLDMHDIGALADAAHEEHWPPLSPIVSQGGRGDRLFVVRSGEAIVERRDEGGGDPLFIARLASGDWFGETALRDGVPRNATVRAGDLRAADLLSFDADVFERYIRPHVTAAGGNGLRSSRRAQLEAVPVFGALAPEDLDRLARVLRDLRVERGTMLFRQGDVADRFYVIVEGAVGVVKDGTPIARLSAGEFFGETALLFTEERTATVATTEDSRFWVLERDAFQTFVRDALLHRRDLMPTVLNRLDSSEPV